MAASLFLKGAQVAARAAHAGPVRTAFVHQPHSVSARMQSSFQHAMHASSISKSATKPDALGTKSKLSIPSQKRVAEELGSAGEECLDNADYEAAQKLFERALKYDPMNHTTSHLATMAKLAKTGALPSM